MGSDIPAIGLVFLAGVISFLSPCVLPIIPAYLSLISGLSFEELQEKESLKQARWRLIGSALSFILGFSLVFVLLYGILFAVFGRLSDEWLKGLRIGGGVIVFIFALHMIGVFRINALFKERRFHMHTNKLGYLGAMLIGAAFVFGWTPCIGPVLTGVVSLAAGTARTWLMIVYAVGLALPFLLTAIFVERFVSSMRKFTKHLRTVEIVSGVLLLAMGVLLVTGSLQLLSPTEGFLFEWSQWLEGKIQ